MIPAGQRDRRISFERATVTTDDYGGEVATWGQVAEAFSRVKFGTGQERREAAQESATQAATFECNATPTLAGIRVKDRIQFDRSAWDITSVAPIGVNRELHFAAVRAV